MYSSPVCSPGYVKKLTKGTTIRAVFPCASQANRTTLHAVQLRNLGLLLLFCMSFSVASTTVNTGPGIIVQYTVNQVLDILTNTELSAEEKRNSAFDIVSRHINFTGMSRRILAINWKKSSEEQRQEFTSLFRKILLKTYWQRLRHYNNEKVEYITGMIEGNRFATVDTVIISDKIEIPITYRMELIDNKWMAYDFLIESLSLITRYRSEYRNIIKTHGINGLLKRMQETVR